MAKKKSREMDLIEPNRTFFGSELVTKAYKCLGLMESSVTKSSSQFFPVTMTQKDFKLVKGATLGKEQKIILAPDFFAYEKTISETPSDEYPNSNRVM